MNRLVKELTYAGAGTVDVISGRTVTWRSRHPDPDQFGVVKTATWNGTSGSALTLQGVALLDNVSVFTVSSTPDSITITLRSTRSDGVVHTMIVHPRYDL